MEEKKETEELTPVEDDNKLKQRENSVILMYTVVGAILIIFLIAGIFFVING